MSFQSQLDKLTEGILHQCRQERSDRLRVENLTELPPLEAVLETDPRKLLRQLQCVNNLNGYITLNKMSALRCFRENKELEGISHLAESHGIYLRELLVKNHAKQKLKKEIFDTSIFTMDPIYVNFDLNEDVWNGKLLKSRLEELPKEWYIVQITSRYKPQAHQATSLEFPKCQLVRTTESIHISVLSAGESGCDPVAITCLSPPTDTYDIMKEIGQILYHQETELKRHYDDGRMYWTVRKKQDTKMKEAISELEKSLFKEWRILLMADFVESNPLVSNALTTLNSLIKKYPKGREITARSRWLLKKITLGSIYLTKVEIARAVSYALQDHRDLAKQVVHFIIKEVSTLKELESYKRNNVILIIDNDLDHIPFETITVLKNQPVSRISCFSFLYTLYKINQDSIEKGCKVIESEKSEALGSCIINPAGDLINTEKRMKAYNDYFMADWQGIYGQKPDADYFKNALRNYSILMYNGHGSGQELISAEKLEENRIKATILLFGCSSGSLKLHGHQYLRFGITERYLMCYSPCVLGMLWLVTDKDIDLLTVNFLSLWLKTNAKMPWSCVDETSWMNGKLEFKKTTDVKSAEFEPELLRAIGFARWNCTKFMTSASVVIRGLPIKIVYK